MQSIIRENLTFEQSNKSIMSRGDDLTLASFVVKEIEAVWASSKCLHMMTLSQI